MSKVYLIHNCNDWVERIWVENVFTTKEKAVAFINEHYPDYVYDERHGQWYKDGRGEDYIYIQEINVH